MASANGLGGISTRGKTEIIFIDGWINNKRYVQLLKKARKSNLPLFPEGFHFVQDNTRPMSISIHYATLNVG